MARLWSWDTWVDYTSYSHSSVTHPSFERLPQRQSVAHVSEDPQDDDAGLEVCDSGLREQTRSVTDSTSNISNQTTNCICHVMMSNSLKN